MPLSLVPYTSSWTKAAQAFNRRLIDAQAPIDFHLCEEASAVQYLVVDGEDVRGGCLADIEAGRVGAQTAEIISIQSPLSEGLFDPKYAGVSLWMVREIVRRWPNSYSIGMGSLNRPYPRLLRALRWKVATVPFYFRVLHGGRVLRSMPSLSQKKGARLAGSIPVLPSIAFNLLHGWRGRRWTGGRVAGLETVSSFSAKDTTAWDRATHLTFGVSRDSAVLNRRYREEMTDHGGVTFARFDGGFLVLKITQFTNHRHFGSLRVATWADGLAEPGKEASLVTGAEELATSMKADLLITNQLYEPIQRVIQERGWLSHPSNFLLAVPPSLTDMVEPATSHVTRRDGDGLVNL